MSSKKPSSDPVEPEGTGVPADDAAEHTTSGSSSSDSAAGTAEPTGSDASADEAPGASADSDTTAKVDITDPDATVKVGKSAASDATVKSKTSADPDATAKVGKTADPDATVKVEKPADPDATVKVDKTADADATAKIDSSDSTDSGEKEPADSDETVVLGKESPAGEATVALGKSAAGKPAEPESDETVKLERSGAAASGTGAEAKKSSGRRSRLPLPALAVAAVLLIAAVVAVGVFFYLANDRQGELDRRAAATKAACDFGNSFATYSGDKADDYVSRLDQNATGEWKKLVSQIGPDLKARFAETQVNSTAADVQCGYESGDGDKARVVLVIDQQFTTAGGPQQQAPGRVKVAANVDMEKVDGRWMVANFDTPMMQQ